MIYFDVSCGRIGDAISAVPYMLSAVRLSGEVGFVGPDFSQWVWDGLDVDGVLARSDFPPPGAVVKRVHPQLSSDECRFRGWQNHMAEGYFFCDNMQPVDQFTLPLKPAQSRKISDRPLYCIAPFSVTDMAGNKIWPLDKWRKLCRELDGDIYVFGATDDPVLDYYGATPCRSQKINQVSTILGLCTALISIDTGIGHLAVMKNMANHVMIYGRGVPPKFAETPFGAMVYGQSPADIGVQDVLEAVHRVEKRTWNSVGKTQM